MKTRKLFTSLAAAVMLSAGLAGSGVVASQSVKADTATTSSQSSSAKKGTIKFRTVNVTVNTDKPKLIAVFDDNGKQTNKIIDSSYTKGQVVPVYYSNAATMKNSAGDTKSINLYFVDQQTVDGKNASIFISSDDVTASATVPTADAFAAQRKSDVQTIQDAYKNRTLKYIVVTPKSKKGALIYYAYKKTRKSKKIYFASSKKKSKHGKKFKSSMIVKHGKTRYVYIGKKRYVKATAVKIVSAKYAPVKLSDDLKNLIQN